MKWKKKHIILLLVLLPIIVCGIYWLVELYSKSKPNDYPQITKKGILHIVTDYNNIGYFASSDTIAGFNHELIQYFKRYTSLRIEVEVENSLEKSFEGLKSGKYDIIARNIPINSELRKEFQFSTPIVISRQVLVQRKAEYNNGILPIRNHLDLAQKTLFVPLKSPALLRLQNLSQEIGDTIFIKEDETYQAHQLVMMVASGEIDYAVCDSRIAEKLSLSIPQIDIKTHIGFTQLEAWAVRADSPILLDTLNVWISRLEKSPDYKHIYKKYYSE